VAEIVPTVIPTTRKITAAPAASESVAGSRSNSSVRTSTLFW
jgi:hypothetical protein